MCQNKRYLPGATMVLGHLELMVGMRKQHLTMCVHPLPSRHLTVCVHPLPSRHLTVCVHPWPSRHLNVSQVVAAHLSEEEKHASTVAWNAR